MVENIMPYFIGLWLGDGFLSLNMGKYWKFGIVCSEFNYDEIYSIVKPTRIKEYQTKDAKYNYYELFTGNKELTSYLLDSCGANAHDKHLPGIPNENYFWELLSGLIDSDGTIDKDSVTFLNSNITLINGVADYLKLLGIGFTIKVRKSNNTKWSDIYVLRFKNSDLKRTKLNLRVEYKRERYELLKSRVKDLVIISDEEFNSNRELLRRVLPRSTFYFFDNNLRVKRVDRDIFNQMIVNR